MTRLFIGPRNTTGVHIKYIDQQPQIQPHQKFEEKESCGDTFPLFLFSCTTSRAHGIDGSIMLRLNSDLL
jgi:hypothetical protein